MINRIDIARTYAKTQIWCDVVQDAFSFSLSGSFHSFLRWDLPELRMGVRKKSPRLLQGVLTKMAFIIFC